jgi:HK97 family phage prohead protease
VLRQPERLSGLSLLKGSSDLVVAGYASVELVDKQGDLITRSALKDAFKKFMTEPKYRNVQLAHSNIQVGEVIPNYTDTEGRMWKSEVDDAGMFVVVQLRNDIEKAREVAAEVRKGNLTGFSIGGQAFKRVNKSDNTHGSYQEISKLELHEITICEKGINPEATFKILKEDKNNKVTKMTDDVMEQMNSVLERLEGRLDSMEKGMPPQFEKKPKKGDEKDEKKEEMDMEKAKDEKEEDKGR